jgi:hypothetical protein
LSESQARRKIVGRRVVGPPKDAALNRDAVLAFIDSLTDRRPVDTGRYGWREVKFIGGERLPDDVLRAWRRWKDRDGFPSLWTLDRLMTKGLGVHIDRYFDFCEEHGQNPWEGSKPSWHP